MDKPMYETISCVILAGGRSRRMGRDKALLSLPGDEQITFVEHLATLLATFGREVLLVARDDTSARDYVSLTNGSTTATTIRIVTDRVADQGPLMGLYSGLSAMHPEATHALVVAVDMPFVQPALLTYLLSHLQQVLVPGQSTDLLQDRHKALASSSPRPPVPTHASRDAILMPVVQAAPQVLLAVYPRSILAIVEECLRQGRHDLRALLKVAPVSYVEEAQLRLVDPELRSFVNVNTPEELGVIL